jgi:hypothetical protein
MSLNGQYDSPGYSAEFCAVTAVEDHSKQVLDFSVEDGIFMLPRCAQSISCQILPLFTRGVIFRKNFFKIFSQKQVEDHIFMLRRCAQSISRQILPLEGSFKKFRLENARPFKTKTLTFKALINGHAKREK